ncbi:unnamed protein product [Mycena citricolor]|uniref:Laccase n=1 Tax=Mycena citricolor TaxID=2018698 RepID=A0AAD2JXT6_9AGAR|nr:unnamed protein product [Mycena citricolor]
MLFFSSLVVLGALPTSFASSVINLPIVNKVIAPDGFTRSTVLAGGTFPGPLLSAQKGDRFTINVQDKLTDTTMLTPTSIHWHGLFQKNSSWADGPSSVTRGFGSQSRFGRMLSPRIECPITPGHSFVYDFATAGQSGTYWYHSHLSTQYCDGLRGPLVIYDPHDPLRYLYDVDDESTVITLADWYHFVAPAAPRIPAANSTLINGLGRYQGGPADAPLSVITVEEGKRYRFRLVAISCDPNYVFSIDGHSLTVIEADGVSTKPVTVDSLQIFAGQRYSFVLKANQPTGNYWIRANPNVGIPGFTGGINSAILRYKKARRVEPTTNSTASNLLLETNLHPLYRSPVAGRPFVGGVDKALNLKISINGTTGKFQINGAPFIPPTVPVLLQILSGAQTAQELLPPGSVYPLPPNAVVEVSIPGGTPGAPHPFHLHGHNFWVVRSAGNTSYNFDDPVLRDVVSTGPSTSDNVTIRFITNNAGPWFLHCHIDWHLEAGLAIVFAEDTKTIVHENSLHEFPKAWANLCPAYDSFLNSTST